VKTLSILMASILAIVGVSCTKANADTASVTVLYNFGMISGTFGPIDGSYPVQPPVEGTDGRFYGTTFDGGTNGDGTVYLMTPQGTLTTLHSFIGGDGLGPRGLLFETNGLFYGTTKQGGIYISDDSLCCGTVFTITPQGTFTSIFSFDGTDGQTSDSGIVPNGQGSYIGTTYGGGTGSTFSGTNATDSYGDSVQNPPGTVYSITPEGTITTLHSFSGTDGANPGKEAVVGTDGNVYGTTLFGGTTNAGTVYTISSAGTFTLLYSFMDGEDGAHPKAQLVQGLDGDFYGTTLDGGGKAGKKWCSANGCGTVFKITPQGTLTTLHDFSGDPEPAHPGSLTLGPDGNFYGTSYTGGTNHLGTVFMITPEGAVTTLYQFAGPDGSYPIAGLSLASDGSFYGTTTSGGTQGQGVVFHAVISTNNSPCIFNVTPPSVTLSAKGGPKTVSVSAKGTNCGWSASTTNDFITITSADSGTGNGKVSFNVPGNTNASELVGTIDIAGQAVSITQETVGGCKFTLSPTVGKVKAAGGLAKVSVKANLSDCEWTAVSTDSFITIRTGSMGTGNGVVTYSVASNTTANSVTGSIAVAGQSLTVIQAGVKAK